MIMDEFEDGQVVKRFKDGRIVVLFADLTVKMTDIHGKEEVIYPNRIY